MLPPPPPSTLFPYTTLFRSSRPGRQGAEPNLARPPVGAHPKAQRSPGIAQQQKLVAFDLHGRKAAERRLCAAETNAAEIGEGDRKSIRLNSSHGYISYAVFC